MTLGLALSILFYAAIFVFAIGATALRRRQHPSHNLTHPHDAAGSLGGGVHHFHNGSVTNAQEAQDHA